MKNKVNAELINEYLKEKGLSKTAFCRECKIAVSTFNEVVKGNDGVRLIALFKMARVMKKELKDMFI